MVCSVSCHLLRQAANDICVKSGADGHISYEIPRLNRYLGVCMEIQQKDRNDHYFG